MRVRAWGKAAAWLGVLSLCAPSAARAADIAWQAPDACQRADVAAAQVEKLVGQPLGSIDWISFEVEVSVADTGAHRVVLRTLTRGSAPREREIQGASCAEVTDAVSVAIALTISEREREREQRAGDAQAGPQREEGGEAPPQSADDGDALRFAIGAGVLVDAGALPNPVPGIDLGGALEWKALRIGAFVAVFVPQDEQLPNDIRGGTFDLLLAGFDVCAKPRLDQLHLLACAGFELGRIGARGDRVRNEREGAAGWYAPRAELGAGYGFAKIARVWLRGGLAVPLARPEFFLDDEDRVHQPSTISFRGLVALEIVL